MSRRRGSPGAESAGGKTLGRILVVEDERDVVELIRYNLVKEGYEVTTAASGPDALRLAREVTPSLVLLDIMVPQLNGWEVVGEMVIYMVDGKMVRHSLS